LRRWFSTRVTTLSEGDAQANAFSHRKFEVLVALATSPVPARTLLSPTAGIGTELLARFTEGFDTTDLKDAKALLDQLGA
jgi:hypothetical protein